MENDKKDTQENLPTKQDQRPKEPVPPDQEDFPGMPSSVKRVVAQFSQMSMPAMFPILDKFTPEHIDKLIDKFDNSESREYQYKGSGRWFMLAYCVLAISVLVFLIMVFKNDADMLRLIITFLIGLGGGFAGGLGIGIKKRQ